MTDTPTLIDLRFGCLSPPLADQLTGYGIADDAIDHFERDKDAILRLHIRGYISDRAYDRALQKLAKDIGRAVLRARESTP